MSGCILNDPAEIESRNALFEEMRESKIAMNPAITNYCPTCANNHLIEVPEDLIGRANGQSEVDVPEDVKKEQLKKIDLVLCRQCFQYHDGECKGVGRVIGSV